MDATGDNHTTAPTTPRPGRYAVDPARSSLSFRTRHLFGLLPVHGTFAVRGGTVVVAEPFTASSVRAEVDADSFRTGHTGRDTAVRSPRFLDTGRHPLITFTAENIGTAAPAGTVTADEGRPATIAGTLTACGVSQPLTLAIGHAEVLADAFTVRARTRIDRTAFGVTASRGLAGRHLDVTLEIRCVRA
ncbi:YceI family protein [Streptomyces sp. L2]|uniref:YceI family protein n=1 Tax=Streptomyces sp. L2 TaxID=2162665 RepID=UPI001012B954|nr:YceI family protein [Streptomyces sp. L2]